MAAATAMVSGSVVAAPLSVSKLSSASAFGGSQAQFAPIRNVNISNSRVVAVKANISEEEPSMTKQILTSVLATGLAISLAGSAFAGSGPGTDGAERTARKADELLKGADGLVNNDSPQRFGPERGFGNGTSANDIGRFTQKAGSGAIPALQDATSGQVSGARDKFASNLEKSQRRVDGIWGKSSRLANDLVADAQGKADGATKGAKNFFGQATKTNTGKVASDVKSKADAVASSAQSGGFFGKIKQQTKGIQGTVAAKGEEAKNAFSKFGK